MNREVKFRGFSKELNKWFYGALDNTLNWADFINTHEHGFSIKNRVESDSIGEFTGLKDKNGVEIYEGDIVHILGGEEHQGFRELNEIGVVTYGLSASFDVVNNKKIHYSFGYCPIDEITVMGDIHENPELLNK